MDHRKRIHMRYKEIIDWLRTLKVIEIKTTIFFPPSKKKQKQKIKTSEVIPATLSIQNQIKPNQCGQLNEFIFPLN